MTLTETEVASPMILDPGRLNPGRRSWLTEDELMFLEHLGTWLDGCGERSKQTKPRTELLRCYREAIALRQHGWENVDERQVREKVKACLEAGGGEIA